MAVGPIKAVTRAFLFAKALGAELEETRRAEKMNNSLSKASETDKSDSTAPTHTRVKSHFARSPGVSRYVFFLSSLNIKNSTALPFTCNYQVFRNSQRSFREKMASLSEDMLQHGEPVAELGF